MSYRGEAIRLDPFIVNRKMSMDDPAVFKLHCVTFVTIITKDKEGAEMTNITGLRSGRTTSRFLR